jgi:hypothetical protein
VGIQRHPELFVVVPVAPSCHQSRQHERRTLRRVLATRVGLPLRRRPASPRFLNHILRCLLQDQSMEEGES